MLASVSVLGRAELGSFGVSVRSRELHCDNVTAVFVYDAVDLCDV